MRSTISKLFVLMFAMVLSAFISFHTLAQDPADDPRKAATDKIKLLLEKAATGDESAKRSLGSMFGARTPAPFFIANQQVAIDFYRYGAALGDAKAMYLLGNLLYWEKKLDESEKWHRLAAENGNADAMYGLSASYEYGEKKDLEQARYWERRAAEAGNGFSMLRLARRYDEGDGVERNPELAAYWYERAEAAGEITPAVTKRKNKECADRMQKGAAEGNRDAMYQLARAYWSGGFHGCGLEQNFPEAIRWYTEAANRGDVIAANNLGAMYGRGQGTPQDFKQAMYWYQKSAESGLPRAMFNVAAMLQSGESGDVDLPGAAAWYRLATEHLSGNFREWKMEELSVRSHIELSLKSCKLRKQLSQVQLRKSDEILRGLESRIKSPLIDSEQLVNSPEYLAACDRGTPSRAN